MSKKNPTPSFPLAPSAPVARLRVIKGPHKGVAYKLVAGKITIGRSSENDIVLINDEKCSRKQAIVSLGTDNTYSIKNLSKKSPAKVNDIVSIQSDLQDGDLIQFGTTVLQFEFKGAPPLPAHAPLQSVPLAPLPLQPAESSLPPAKKEQQELALMLDDESNKNLPKLQQSNPPPAHMPFPQQGPAYYPTSSPLNQKKQKNKKKLMPKIILGILLLGGVWLFSQDSEQKKIKKEDKLRTLANMEENIKTLEELKEKELEDRSKNSLSTYKNAQFAYIKGIRDYRKGIYGRAIEAFRVCKTIYPQHDLCGSYLKKAQIKKQQLVQAWMVAGKHYRQKRRFKACMSSFQNVMTALQDKKTPTYKEAKENFDICKIKYGDRY